MTVFSVASATTAANCDNKTIGTCPGPQAVPFEHHDRLDDLPPPDGKARSSYQSQRLQEPGHAEKRRKPTLESCSRVPSLLTLIQFRSIDHRRLMVVATVG